MPYISPLARERVEEHGAVFPGDMNYLFAKIIDAYVDEFGLSYGTINDVVGALEGCKAEFYRRIAVPYENLKRRENGEVFTASVQLLSDAYMASITDGA